MDRFVRFDSLECSGDIRVPLSSTIFEKKDGNSYSEIANARFDNRFSIGEESKKKGENFLLRKCFIILEIAR